MAQSVNNLSVENGAEVEHPEVLVELGFGETLAHLPLFDFVSVSSTWKGVLEKHGVKVDSDEGLVIIPESGHWVDEVTKQRPLGYLRDKVGDLKGKIHSFRDLQVVRLVKEPSGEKVSWKTVYANRLLNFVQFDVLACFGAADYFHLDIVRNLNSTDSFQTTIEINHERPDVLPKYIHYILEIVSEWNTSGFKFPSFVNYTSLGRDLFLHAKNFLFSRNIDYPLVELNVYLALRKCYCEFTWKPSSATATERVFLSTKAVEEAVAASRVILTLMSFEKYRVLHCLLYSIHCILNEKFLRQIGQSSEEVIRTFIPLIVNFDQERAIELVTFFVKNFDTLFETSEEIQKLNGIAESMAAGLPPDYINSLKKKTARAASTVPVGNQFCLRMPVEKFESENSATLNAKRKVFEGIVRKADEKDKKKMLREFKSKYPDIFAEKNGDEQLALIQSKKLAEAQERQRLFQSGLQMLKASFTSFLRN